MDSELQRLRFRVRQLERELRALRAPHDREDEPRRDVVREPPLNRRRVLNAPARASAE